MELVKRITGIDLQPCRHRVRVAEPPPERRAAAGRAQPACAAAALSPIQEQTASFACDTIQRRPAAPSEASLRVKLTQTQAVASTAPRAAVRRRVAGAQAGRLLSELCRSPARPTRGGRTLAAAGQPAAGQA